MLDECLYLHVDPSTRLPPCPHYDRGFCPLGPQCSKKHVRKQICPFYLAGFCPDGSKNCKQAHPRWPTDLPKPTVRVERDPEEVAEEQRLLRENAEREEERERERFMEDGGGRGRGRGRWNHGGGFGGGRGRGEQRRQRGRGHY
jgi:cleavage and polyadenylation specificity factor subunit 4